MYKFCSFDVIDNFNYTVSLLEALHAMEIYSCVAFSSCKVLFIIDLTKLNGFKKQLLSEFLVKADVENIEYK